MAPLFASGLALAGGTALRRGIRPQNLRLHATAAPGRLPVRLSRCEYLGAKVHAHLHADAQASPLIARTPPAEVTALAARRLAGPAAALMLLLLPTLAILVLSFTDAELGASDITFLGLEAYTYLLTDRSFWGALRNTATYVGLVAPASILLGLGLALLIEAEAEGRAFFRSVYFLPVVSLLVAIASVWQYLMHPSFGPINLVLRMLGFAGVNWLGSSDNVLYALAIIGIWQSTGFSMVLFIDGMTMTGLKGRALPFPARSPKVETPQPACRPSGSRPRQLRRPRPHAHHLGRGAEALRPHPGAGRRRHRHVLPLAGR